MAPTLNRVRIDEILAPFGDVLGPAFPGYRNHVCRVAGFASALVDHAAGDSDSDRNETSDKILVAACFHDLGLWWGDTLDYLEPSIALVRRFLETAGLTAWQSEIERMIDLHHKLTPVRGEPLVEAFRRADLVDLSLGLVRFGLPRPEVRRIRRAFPNAGFHAELLRRTGAWFRRHPGRPLPVLKW